MQFLSNLFLLLAALSASTNAITITSPSASSYWVQFTTNTIAWTAATNDPPQVSLQVINSNVTLLNGAFSIAEYTAASAESFTVTNVTLNVADGYIVQMVNPANSSQVYASSAPFSVKANGTTPAPGTAPASMNGMAGMSGNMANMPGMNMSGNMANMPGMNMTNMSGMNGTRNANSGFNNNGTAGSNARNSDASSVSASYFGLLSLLVSTGALMMMA